LSIYQNSNNYTHSHYPSFCPYNNFRSLGAYGENKDFCYFSVNNLTITDRDSSANRAIVYRDMLVWSNAGEDTLRYVLHVSSTEALLTYRLAQERPKIFDHISEKVCIESLAI
jgi:hypothetical protein